MKTTIKTVRFAQDVCCQQYKAGDRHSGGIVIKATCLGPIAEPHPHTNGEDEWELEIAEFPPSPSEGDVWVDPLGKKWKFSHHPDTNLGYLAWGHITTRTV